MTNQAQKQSPVTTLILLGIEHIITEESCKRTNIITKSQPDMDETLAAQRGHEHGVRCALVLYVGALEDGIGSPTINALRKKFEEEAITITGSRDAAITWLKRAMQSVVDKKRNETAATQQRQQQPVPKTIPLNEYNTQQQPASSEAAA